ncbi:hypothetical protein N7G274_009521 [Stereocaulon virgatum]|uniref:Uncharacterized protein n=1 Tax=Stereocaulon virgatum TaxID=373712 RepID=A0ABR3ZXV2_9LECA
MVSQSKVSGTGFSDGLANAIQERFRRVVGRAVSLGTRFIRRTDPKSISAILYDCSPGAPPFFIRLVLDASTSSAQSEFTTPIAVRHECAPDVTTDLIVGSPSRLNHSSVPSSPVSMQMDFGPGPLAITNRTLGDHSIALHTTGSSSLPSVASSSLQNCVGALRSPVEETEDDNPKLVAHRALRTRECSKAVGVGASPMSDERQFNHGIKVEGLRPSKGGGIGAVVQPERASRSHHQPAQSHGPLTIHEYSEPLDHCGPSFPYHDRHGLRHSPQPKDEDVHESCILAQVVQTQRRLTTDREPPEKSVMTGLLDVNPADGFIEFLSNIDGFTCANLCCRGRLAQQRRGIYIVPSPEFTNQIPDQTQSLDTLDASSPILRANLDSGLIEDPAYHGVEEASLLITQNELVATEPTPTGSPPTTNPPTIAGAVMRTLIF